MSYPILSLIFLRGDVLAKIVLFYTDTLNNVALEMHYVLIWELISNRIFQETADGGSICTAGPTKATEAGSMTAASLTALLLAFFVAIFTS